MSVGNPDGCHVSYTPSLPLSKESGQHPTPPSALWVEEEVHLLFIDLPFGALLGSIHVSGWLSG